MDKRTFLQEVRSRAGTDLTAEPEECARAVFEVLHERLESGQASHIASHLPKEFKDDWQLGTFEKVRHAVIGDVEKRDRDEFLDAVRERAGLRSKDEALTATTAVFSTLRQVLPEKDVRDTAAELPDDLSDLWIESPT
jgi:uncharacterized protein (DUF2267 family)